jgi:hypothetical protein
VALRRAVLDFQLRPGDSSLTSVASFDETLKCCSIPQPNG